MSVRAKPMDKVTINTIKSYSDMTPEEIEEVKEKIKTYTPTKTIKEYDDGRVELIISMHDGLMVGVMTDRTIPDYFLVNTDVLNEHPEYKKFINYPS